MVVTADFHDQSDLGGTVCRYRPDFVRRHPAGDRRHNLCNQYPLYAYVAVLVAKAGSRYENGERLILSFGVTDEVFAVAIRQRKELTARYLAGLILTPYAGWALGTVLGATATGVLPLSVRSALGIAIYGMFIAIIIPPSREAKP